MTEMKKQHSLPRVRLMRRAAVIRRNNDMNRRDALIIAHRIGGLIRKMHRENVKFCYTKQDGTVRHAVGTLTGYQHSFHRPYMPRPENTFVVYYDLEAKGWARFMPKISFASNEFRRADEIRRANEFRAADKF